jgi:hypothetical protein
MSEAGPRSAYVAGAGASVSRNAVSTEFPATGQLCEPRRSDKRIELNQTWTNRGILTNIEGKQRPRPAFHRWCLYADPAGGATTVRPATSE